MLKYPGTILEYIGYDAKVSWYDIRVSRIGYDARVSWYDTRVYMVRC
jgi:hypothetical protein